MKRITRILLIVSMLMLTACNANKMEDIESETTIETTLEVAETVAEETPEKEVDKEIEALEINVVTPYGTPTLSMVKMYIEEPTIADNVTVNYEATQATDVLTAKLINHEADIAIVPSNLAANLYNKGIEYKIVGSNIWGVLYLASSEEITDVDDLKGKNISLIGRGLSPDAILRYVLSENGIDPETDVTLEYYSGSSELATNYISEQTNLALIPEPLLTNVLLKRADSMMVIDLQEEWSSLTGLGKYPQTSLIVSETLINEYPEVVEAFIKEYETAIGWVNENPAEAGAYYEELGIGLNATIVEKAIPGCNFDYVPISEAKDALNAYLGALYEFNPELLGGNSVDETLYYNE